MRQVSIVKSVRACAVGLSLIQPAVLVGCACESERAAPVRVAAASDLSLAFEELGRKFEARTKQRVSFSFGSTGLLAKQLREGAPFDVFAAANEAFVDEAISGGACDARTKASYARGRIAIWSLPKLGKPAKLNQLTDSRFSKIAIANPEHAPYGQAAKEALLAAGIWDEIRPRLVYAENVRQALQLAQTGNVEAAIVALSLVIGENETAFALVEETRHRAIEQTLVVCRYGKQRASGRAFAAYVNSSEGRAVMRRYGFLLPSE